MKKLSSLILITLVISISFLFSIESIIVDATNSASIISFDTTWTKANSPYRLISSVRIKSGITLKIEAGVHVNLNGNYIQADGTLIVQGNSNEKIHLNYGSLILNSNSILENTIVNSKLFITANSSSPTISNNQIYSRIIVKGGTPLITDNVLYDGIHADAIGGPITIKNNYICSKSGFVVVYVQGIHADIWGNTIVGNNNMGIQIYHIISSATIINNKISNCSYGIHLFTGPDYNQITKNAIFNNIVGIYNRAGLILKDNTIAYNEIGLKTAHLVSIENNNFMKNSGYNLENNHIVDFNAPNNWWGTTDSSLISLMILDKNEESAKGDRKSVV